MVGQRTVHSAAITRFGELTGDYSAIHFDEAAGREAGHGGVIAHGLLTACWAVGGLTLHAPSRLAIGAPDILLSSFSIRLSRVVAAGDSFRVRAVETESASETEPGGAAVDPAPLTFETFNQHGEITSRGQLGFDSHGLGSEVEAVMPWSLTPGAPFDPVEIHYAEDLVESGPCAESMGRTLTETDIVRFARHVGELNPLYLDAEFARRSSFGARVAPPMLTFCLAFSDFLQALLRTPMPARGFAGHIGDEWRLLRPIRLGDTLRTRHKPLGYTLSRSQPGMAIVRFGLQVLDQEERVVQQGETVMLIPSRAARIDGRMPSGEPE